MPSRNTPEAFWDRVDRSGGPDDCWPWQMSCNQAGYGHWWYEGRLIQAHRLAYHFATGETPDDLCVLHRCDNPPCCNPAHLFLGTRTDNNRDRNAKGRGRCPSGEAHPNRKLTIAVVQEIRTLCREGVPLPVIAAKFGVTPATVCKANLGQTWKSVPLQPAS